MIDPTLDVKGESTRSRPRTSLPRPLQCPNERLSQMARTARDEDLSVCHFPEARALRAHRVRQSLDLDSRLK